MTTAPDFDSFAKCYDRGESQVVWTRLVSDLETPVSAMLKLARDGHYCFLLESVEGGAVRGRYSMIGVRPDLIWRTQDGKAEINRQARHDPTGPFTPCEGSPLQSLRALLRESRIELSHDLPPMSAGLFGYMGYDMVRLMERLPAPNPDPLGLPDGIMMRPTVMCIFDSVKDEVTLVTPVFPDRGQGLYRGRRHLPGGAVATIRDGFPAASDRALPRAAAGQSLALPVLSRLRFLLAHRLVAGDPGQGA